LFSELNLPGPASTCNLASGSATAGADANRVTRNKPQLSKEVFVLDAGPAAAPGSGLGALER
jgi:hypothetical protein